MGNNSPSAAWIVPCYNEETRLDIDEFIAFFRSHRSIAAILVDDGSRDGTVEVLREIQGEVGDDQVDVLSLEKNRGKAEAIRRGMLHALSMSANRSANWNFVGFLDADLATPFSEMLRLVEVLERRCDIELVIGSRLSLKGHHVHRTFFRKIVGRVFATIASRMMGIPVRDTQCGAKMFRCGPWMNEVFKCEFKDRWLFDVEILARTSNIFGKGASERVYECPLETWNEIAGSRLKFSDFAKAPWRLVRLGIEYRMVQAVRRWFIPPSEYYQATTAKLDDAAMQPPSPIFRPRLYVPEDQQPQADHRIPGLPPRVRRRDAA